MTQTLNNKPKKELSTWEELGFTQKPKFKEWVRPTSKAEGIAAFKTAIILGKIQADSKTC